ncbi:MAG: transglutaminase domain-containing protein [Candidatus Peregrinibacteria bacterium]|nr:transglutaminase domain-containing protein [Candidatus Peregrinibacteria bacterium]
MPRESLTPGPNRAEHAREMLRLAERAAAGNLKVLPGKQWAYAYPKNAEARNAILQGLVNGTVQPDAVADQLKPQALLYDQNDLSHGLEYMQGRIRDATATVEHYDYDRFARFIASMQGKQVDLTTVQSLYDGTAQCRTRRKVFDSYGGTGQTQLRAAFQHEARAIAKDFPTMRGMTRVLSALKLHWMESAGFAKGGETAAVQQELTPLERELVEALRAQYTQYAETGEEAAYEALAHVVRESLPSIDHLKEQRSPSMERLAEELREFEDRAVPPQTPGDPAISPDDQDEYITPPQEGGLESPEGQAPVMFEISPSGTSTKPLIGDYCAGRKSYYDASAKTWSKRKNLQNYRTTIQGVERQQYRGVIDTGLKSLPLPNGYAFDASTLQCSDGAKGVLQRDQNGCFYIQADTPCAFTCEFLKEDPLFAGPPIDDDREPLTTQSLSHATEQFLQSLQGDDLQRAQQIRQYIHRQHFYPGGGDLNAAQALQLKLRSASADTYIQSLDASEYLECYSANTLFVHSARRLRIPARLVVGHKIESAKDGKARITTSTGHAWSEVWDGSAWRRIDATPPPKPEDMKKDQKGDVGGQGGTGTGQGPPTEEANDGGLPMPEQPQQGDITEQVRDRTLRKLESVHGDRMGEADEQDVAQGEETMDEAQREVKQSGGKAQELRDKTKQAKSFEDLENVQKEIDQEQLGDRLQEELEKDIAEKLDQKKREIEKQVNDMHDGGFIDDEQKKKLKEALEKQKGKELDTLKKNLAENPLYKEYNELKREVMPLVKEWTEKLARELPKVREMQPDETKLARSGKINKKEMHKPLKLMTGKVKHPKVELETTVPRFIANVVLDVSLSMKDDGKLRNGRKYLIFINELFSAISEQYGYMRFGNFTFAQTISVIKTCGQDYNASTRYTYDDDGREIRGTVKQRVMACSQPRGGTNMLPAMQKVAADLRQEKKKYPDHFTALYYIGDGEDTCKNAPNVRAFMQNSSKEGFGEHAQSAILMGGGAAKQILSSIFGEKNTTVVPPNAKDPQGSFRALVNASMAQMIGNIRTFKAKHRRKFE